MPKARKRAYHHGHLRQALLDAAIPLLRKGGPDALTLRAVARAAGVSQTAPYRHFTDRGALVSAVADDGFQRLHAQLLSAMAAPARTLGAAPETARGGLQALALAYVRFALVHSAEYRVMFGGKPSQPRQGSAREAVFEFLRGGIEMLQREKLVRDGDSNAMALTAWALVHGLVMLALDGQLSGKPAPTPDELTVTATELLMFGMAN